MLNKHFLEFLGSVESRGVGYLVVGGYAVGVHGFPRYTGDLDIFVAVNRDNAAKILATISDFGFQSLNLKQEDFLEEDTVVEIGREPIKIRIPTGIDGVTFESFSRDRLLVTIEGRKVPFIGFESLLQYKAASPRAKDRIDLAELRKIEGIGRANDRGQEPEL